MAKFKVGDVVEVTGQGLATKGKKGRVVKVDESRRGWPYTVSFSGSVSDGEYAENELAKAFNSTDPVVANAMAYAVRKANVAANSWVSHEHLGDLKKAMFYANIDYSRLEKEGLGMWSSREEYAQKEFYRKNQHYLKVVEPFGQDKDIGQKAKAFASILKTAKPAKEDFRKLKDAAAELNDEVIRLTVGR